MSDFKNFKRLKSQRNGGIWSAKIIIEEKYEAAVAAAGCSLIEFKNQKTHLITRKTLRNNFKQVQILNEAELLVFVLLVTTNNIHISNRINQFYF